MTSERLFNSFMHPEKLLYPPKQISGYAPVQNLRHRLHCLRASLPNELIDPVCGSDSFKQFLKTVFFVFTNVTSTLEFF